MSTHRCWKENLYMLTALETWCLLPRVANIMCSASLPSKRTDWPFLLKQVFLSHIDVHAGVCESHVSECFHNYFFKLCFLTQQIRDTTQEPCGRLSFTKEPRTYRSLTHNAICNLNITLPAYSKVIMNIQ